MEWVFSGQTGFVLVDFAFVTALIATVGFFVSMREDSSADAWYSLGKWAFIAHAVAVPLSIIVLLGMIITKRYEYHYVFSHSSNELPLHYVIACLWEGQEGSFLLWLFWHAVLGILVLFWVKKDWHTGVLATLSSVQAILASMVLGVYFDTPWVKLFFMALVLIPTVYFILKSILTPVSEHEKTIGIAGVLLGPMVLYNILADQTGFYSVLLSDIGFIAALGYVLLFIAGLIFLFYTKQLPFGTFAAGVVITGLALVAGWQTLGQWKIGSSPFLHLREAFPDNPTLLQDPDFVPANGNGLNPLLQNYWMVIHPPTLFLGFAATIIPFGFVLTALIKQDYSGWLRPATPWTLFAVAILGVGIIMGGYWAYETLNFGGYWNWDPVENASLVPWLTGVGAIHAMLTYRHGKTNLHLAMVLVVATFILVLYSTFLTRSGILGDASVHSFTDLGLSGQLLVLLMAYLLLITLLFIYRWKQIPDNKKDIPLWTREFFLFLAVLVLLFAAIEITVVTSLPVFNAVFGTKFAPPTKIQYFYYKWNVWFGIGIALLSAIGQFFFWTKVEQKNITSALMRPLLIAAGVTLVIMITLAVYRWDFIYNDTYREAIALALVNGNLFDIGLAYAGYGVLFMADDLLLITGLFAIFANIDIFYRLVSKSKLNLRQVGGSLAHIGFSLMLIGILFSSGYQDTVSINVTPDELSEKIPEQNRKDNVMLVRDRPRQLKGYQVTYRGKVQAIRPISELKVLSEAEFTSKVAFVDGRNHRYAMDVPTRFFAKNDSSSALFQPTSTAKPQKNYDLTKLKFFIESQLELLRPSMINERSLYALEFRSLEDSAKRFVLLPEAEMAKGESIISHPDRKIFADKDLYVHVSSVPAEDKITWDPIIPERGLSVGDTFKVKGYTVKLESVEQIKDGVTENPADICAKLNLRIQTADKYYLTAPAFVIDNANSRILNVDSYVTELGLRFGFLYAKPEQNKLFIQALQRNDDPDFVVMNAIHKPWINLLWLGTFILTIGFGVAIARRIRENKHREN